MSRSMPILLLVLGAVLVVSLAIFNVNPVAFSIFGATMYVPEGVLLGGGFAFGVLLTLPLYWAKVKAEQASAKALTKWDAEDQKLLTQVQSDKEKQLEAKIATLEAALQRALKK